MSECSVLCLDRLIYARLERLMRGFSDLCVFESWGVLGGCISLVALDAFYKSKLLLLIVPVLLNFRYNERKEDRNFLFLEKGRGP